MTEQWQELKEAIIELRDSNGTLTQQEVCKFLVNYMEVLEKQMQEPTEKCKGCYYNDGDTHAECVVCDKESQPSEDTEVIKVSKGAVKARQGRFVVYDVDWLKKNFYTTEEKIYGQPKQPCEDCISREQAKQFLYYEIERLHDDGLYDCFSKIIDDMYNELSSVTPISEDMKEAYFKGYDYGVKDWFKSKTQPCDDCVSRADVKEQMLKYGFNAPDMTVTEFVEDCLQPVTPRPKIGRWIKHDTGHSIYYDCSRCGCAAPCTETADKILWKLANFCPDCGAKMEVEK